MTLAFAHVNASCAFGIRNEVAITFTAVCTHLVHAPTVDAHPSHGTFIDICTVCSLFIQLKAVIANATKHSRHVFTTAMFTQGKHLTLVNIDTTLFIFSWYVANLTLAFIRASLVGTLSVFAETVLIKTLVYIITDYAISCVTWLTNTAERAWDVDTRGIIVTLGSACSTFVDIDALIIASSESRFTSAKEAAYGVGTVSISTALGQVYFTLIHINTSSCSFGQDVSNTTQTLKRARSVTTYAITTQLRIILTFVYINAGSPVD